MAFAKEVEDWISELGLTAEERKVFDPFLDKPERIEKVRGSVLRQSEFTKKMQSLDKQKSDLEAAVAEKERIVAEDAAALGTWKQSADRTIIENQKALEDAKTRAYRMEERMKTLATQYGVDPKELGLDGEPKPPETKTSSALDASEFDKKYMKREDAEALQRESRAAPYVASRLIKIMREQERLFPGKELDPDELITNAQKNKRSLDDEWSISQDVPKRRAELQEKQIEDRINERVAEERTKILSEHKLPVTRGAESGSPILAMRESLKLEGTDRNKTAGTSAVDAAVSSYNTGKYREAPAQPAEAKT